MKSTRNRSVGFVGLFWGNRAVEGESGKWQDSVCGVVCPEPTRGPMYSQQAMWPRSVTLIQMCTDVGWRGLILNSLGEEALLVSWEVAATGKRQCTWVMP